MFFFPLSTRTQVQMQRKQEIYGSRRTVQKSVHLFYFISFCSVSSERARCSGEEDADRRQRRGEIASARLWSPLAPRSVPASLAQGPDAAAVPSPSSPTLTSSSVCSPNAISTPKISLASRYVLSDSVFRIRYSYGLEASASGASKHGVVHLHICHPQWQHPTSTRT